jgi:uncharacterized protein YndB with AHSA1/START domain
VFRAYTDPALIPQWWGPKILTTTVDIMNVRPGGEWRCVQRDPAGNQHTFRGVYHEIKSPERIVQTFEYENMPGHALLEIITFEDHDGGTKVTVKSIYPSVEERDGMVQALMQHNLVDEYRLMVYPLVRGSGKRLFKDGSQALEGLF